MCTLSIIAPASGTFVLAFNRDEQPHRGELPPSVTEGAPRIAMPLDLQTSGSWIAVNDAGLAFALLNRNERSAPSAPSHGHSRAAIVPQVARARTLSDVPRLLEAIASRIDRDFRLIATDGIRVLEAIGGQGATSVQVEPLVRPFVRASSGLGDALVIGPRSELFEAAVARLPPPLLEDAQRAFHMHRWSDQRERSVLMDRRDARTVSHTLIRVDPTRVELAHRLRDGDGFAPWTSQEMSRA